MMNELAKEIYKNAVSKGFYEDNKATNMGERLALIHSEVSEALEADRENRFTKLGAVYGTDHLSDIFFKEYFKKEIKDTFEDELADVIIRCLDTAAYKGIDIEAHIQVKMRYNSLREKMHGKKY